MAQTIEHAKPKARKTHACELCARIIDAGETYDRYRMVGDDGPYVWKQCAHCTALLRIHGDAIVWDWYEGYADEDIREWETADDAQALLKARWQERWRDTNGVLYPVPAIAAPTQSTTAQPARDEKETT